ncbi:FAD/NAD-P-binding domain-containing protein [Thelephora ganbajun]|uniref:FAD/NAD-P-binding domain-containing protein n=1 Tax=Thelephora ganbajun TaxID=370292 RepID=A0ACB6ZTB6_THEGA|nr:FAD/NAD-P-binding domain-containing protein [Thelephora ganbajun]
MLSIRSIATRAIQTANSASLRSVGYATLSEEKHKYKVVVIGAGTGGLVAANQVYNRFKAAGKPLNPGDIAIIDPAEYHYYQPGWTLVASGLANKSKTRQPLSSLIPSHLSYIVDSVKSFEPKSSSITTSVGRRISYDNLVVAAGLQINWNAVQGLTKALADPNSGVSSAYSYDTADKVWSDVQALRSGRAIFTQPAGIIKCAGAPQKVMWMAWSTWENILKSGSNIKTEFYTGMPTMFAVPKYSRALDELRIKRGIEASFGHNLVSVDSTAKKATFKKGDGSVVEEEYTLLHAVPPMGPLDVIKGSSLADEAGWVNVDKNTLRHVEYGNVWSLGDSSNLPTSKTAAAITAQAPVLAENLFRVTDTGSIGKAGYDGYTSCPLLTGHGELMLAEFKYGLEPKETFAKYLGDQAKPRREYYYLKKNVFPFVYWNYMLRGQWFGPKGVIRPDYA